jgi:hypothetical protein
MKQQQFQIRNANDNNNFKLEMQTKINLKFRNANNNNSKLEMQTKIEFKVDSQRVAYA